MALDDDIVNYFCRTRMRHVTYVFTLGTRRWVGKGGPSLPRMKLVGGVCILLLALLFGSALMGEYDLLS